MRGVLGKVRRADFYGVMLTGIRRAAFRER
jgi:hypothetical protein